MLHLLPLRWLATTLTLIGGGIGMLLLYTGGASGMVRYAGIAYLVLLFALTLAWRRFRVLHKAIFPYLGGDWKGTLDIRGNFGPRTIPITVTIQHSLLGLKMTLNSAQSYSTSMFAHADRDTPFAPYSLYYGYTTRKKDGIPGEPYEYRGLAILRVENEPLPKLIGKYFTESGGEGEMRVTPVALYPWWRFWH